MTGFAMTAPEREVLRLVADGLSNSGIGVRLHITAGTSYIKVFVMNTREIPAGSLGISPNTCQPFL